MTTFVFKGAEGVPAGLDFGPLVGELNRLGFPSIIVRTPRSESRTPNQDSANAIVEALRDVHDEVVIVGVSHQGMFLPLVAEMRPIRRLVYVNAIIPRPGRPFMDVLKEERVFAPGLLEATIESTKGMTGEFLEITLDPGLPAWLRKLMKLSAWTSGAKASINELLEPCPLKELPKVDSIYICAAQDQAVFPEWQQRAARESLGVDAIVIPGARHGSILTTHRREVAAAAVQGLRPNDEISLNNLETKSLNETTGTFETQSEVALLKKFLLRRIRLRGVLFSAVPSLVFVGAYLFSSSLRTAIWSSVGVAFLIFFYHIFRRAAPWPAVAGVFITAIEASVACLAGSVRGFFLLRIWGSLFFASVFLLSVLIRWPLVGVVWSKLTSAGLRWRSDRSASLYYSIATLSWVVVFATRFVVLHRLYESNAVGWLAFTQAVLGRPLAAVAVLINIWAIRRIGRRKKEEARRKKEDRGRMAGDGKRG